MAPAAVDLGRDVERGAGRLDLPPNGVAVVALVRQHDVAARQAFEQQRAGLAVGGLPAGQQEGERAAETVGEGVDLDRAPPRERPMAWLCSPLCPPRHSGEPSRRWSRSPPERAAHRLGRASRTGRPSPPWSPAHEAVVEGLLRSVEIARRIRPAPSRFQHVDDAADHAPVVHALLARVSFGRSGAILANCSSVSRK